MNHQFTSGSLKCHTFALFGDIYFLWFLLFFLFHWRAFYRQLLQEQHDFCSPIKRKRVGEKSAVIKVESPDDRLLYVYHWTEGCVFKLMTTLWMVIFWQEKSRNKPTSSQCGFWTLGRRSFLLDSCQSAPSMHLLSSIWPGLALFSFFFPSFFHFLAKILETFSGHVLVNPPPSPSSSLFFLCSCLHTAFGINMLYISLLCWPKS